MAEILTNGDPEILSKKLDNRFYFNAFRTLDAEKKEQKIDPKEKSGQVMNDNLFNITSQTNDHVIRFREQPTAAISARSDRGIYPCYICGFSTTRVNVIICHLKFHRLNRAASRSRTCADVQSNMESTVPGSQKRRATRKATERDSAIVQLPKQWSPDESKDSDMRTRSDTELKKKLLADWSVDSDDDVSVERNDSDGIKSTQISDRYAENFDISHQCSDNQQVLGKSDPAILLQESERFLQEVDEFTRDPDFVRKQRGEKRLSNIQPKTKISPSLPIRSESYSSSKSEDRCRKRFSCFDFVEDDDSDVSPFEVFNGSLGVEENLIERRPRRKYETNPITISVAEEGLDDHRPHALVSKHRDTLISSSEKESEKSDREYRAASTSIRRLEVRAFLDKNRVTEKRECDDEDNTIESHVKTENRVGCIVQLRKDDGTSSDVNEASMIVSQSDCDVPSVSKRRCTQNRMNTNCRGIILNERGSMDSRDESHCEDGDSSVNCKNLDSLMMPTIDKSYNEMINEVQMRKFSQESKNSSDSHASKLGKTVRTDEKLCRSDPDQQLDIGLFVAAPQAVIRDDSQYDTVCITPARDSLHVGLEKKRDRVLRMQMSFDVNIGSENLLANGDIGIINNVMGIDTNDSGERAMKSEKDEQKLSEDSSYNQEETMKNSISNQGQNTESTLASPTLMVEDCIYALGRSSIQYPPDQRDNDNEVRESQIFQPMKSEKDLSQSIGRVKNEVSVKDSDINPPLLFELTPDRSESRSKMALDAVEKSVLNEERFDESIQNINDNDMVQVSKINHPPVEVHRVKIESKDFRHYKTKPGVLSSIDQTGTASSVHGSTSIKKREKPRIIGNITLKEPMILKSKLTENYARRVKLFTNVSAVNSSDSNQSIDSLHDQIDPLGKSKGITRTKRNICPKPLIGMRTISSQSLTNTIFDDSTNSVQQNSRSLIAMDLDIASLPFILSDDILDSKSIEQKFLSFSTELQTIGRTGSLPSLRSPKPVDPIETNNEMWRMKTSNQETFGPLTPLKHENESKKPTITRIESDVPISVSKAPEKVYKMDSFGVGLASRGKSTPGRYVVVQTSLRQKCLRTHKTEVVPTSTDSGSAQIVHQDGKVVILTPFKPDECEEESFSIGNSSRVFEKEKSKCISGNERFQDSKFSLQKIGSSNFFLEESYGQHISNSVGRNKKNITLQQPISPGSFYDEHLEDDNRVNSLNSPGDQLNAKQTSIHQTAKPSRNILESAKKSLVREVNENKPHRIVSKGTVLTPITGSQVRALAAKSLKGSSTRTQKNVSKLGEFLIKPASSSTLPNSDILTKVQLSSIGMVPNSTLQCQSGIQKTPMQKPLLAALSSSASNDVDSNLIIGNDSKVVLSEKEKPYEPHDCISHGHCEGETGNESLPKIQEPISSKEYLHTTKECFRVVRHRSLPIPSRYSPELGTKFDLEDSIDSPSVECKSEHIEVRGKKSSKCIPKELQEHAHEDVPPPGIDYGRGTDAVNQIQIVALSTENDGDSQSYILVTVDDRGNVIPLRGDSIIRPTDARETVTEDDDTSHLQQSISSSIDHNFDQERYAETKPPFNRILVTNELIPEEGRNFNQLESFLCRNQDILATALADTNLSIEPDTCNTVLSTVEKGLDPNNLSNRTILQSTLIPPPEHIYSPSVLETSSTLNQPIMTPLEVPSTRPSDTSAHNGPRADSEVPETNNGIISIPISDPPDTVQSLLESEDLISNLVESVSSQNISVHEPEDPRNRSRINSDEKFQYIENIIDSPTSLLQNENSKSIRLSITGNVEGRRDSRKFVTGGCCLHTGVKMTNVQPDSYSNVNDGDGLPLQVNSFIILISCLIHPISTII